MIPATEAAKVIERRRGDAVVVSTSKMVREWSRVSHRPELDVDLLDCFDSAASVALGICLARPDLKIIVVDTNATLRKNPGTLLTVGEVGPHNLVHFLFQDADHLSTGGVPISGLDSIDFASLAKTAGYVRVYCFDDLEELALTLEEALEAPGPTFVALRAVHQADVPPLPDRTMAESLKSVKKALATKVRLPLPERDPGA